MLDPLDRLDIVFNPPGCYIINMNLCRNRLRTIDPSTFAHIELDHSFNRLLTVPVFNDDDITRGIQFEEKPPDKYERRILTLGALD